MPEIFDADNKKFDRPTKKRVRHSAKANRKRQRVYESLKKEANPNPLSAFAVCPPKTHFSSQDEMEKVVLLLRQHPVTNVGWILLAVLLVFAPLILDYIPLISFLPANFQFMTLYLYYFMVVVFVIGQFLYWYFNVYIVTDERVIDVDFFGLNYRDVLVSKIDRIQDMNFRQGGLMGTFFNYGNVYIETAGESANFDFAKVPHPSRVVKILGALIDEEGTELLSELEHD